MIFGHRCFAIEWEYSVIYEKETEKQMRLCLLYLIANKNAQHANIKTRKDTFLCEEKLLGTESVLF